MASEIRPGRGLINHGHSGATYLFTNAVDLKCLDPTIFPVTYANTVLLAAVAVFSDLNIDGCCDDVPFLFLSSFLCLFFHCWDLATV